MNYAFQNILSKYAGRIKVEQYNVQIYDIIGKITDFLTSKKHFDLGEKRVQIGTVYFDISGKKVPLHIKVFLSKLTRVGAGIEVPSFSGQEPTLYVNLAPFEWKYPSAASNELLPLLTHELTHFLDSAYISQFETLPAEQELQSAFFNDFKNEYTKAHQTINIGDVSSENWKSDFRDITKIVRKDLLKFCNSTSFNQLLSKYNLKFSRELYNKIYSVAYKIHVDDLSFFMETGGDPFGTASSKEEKETNKKIKEKAHHYYFNSETEIKAYINQIISEIESYLRKPENSSFIINLIKGNSSLSSSLDDLLSNSPTYNQTKDKWSKNTIKRLYKNIGIYFAQQYRKKSVQDRAEKLGIKLSPHELLVYRYIQKLMDTSPDKLEKLLSNDKFKNENKNVIAVLNDFINFSSRLEKLTKSLKELKLFT